MDKSRPTVSSLHGVVAAAHPLAAQAGARLLRAGGNAFDAAAATAAALNVVEPYMSGLAGMGMATCYIAGEQRIRTLDFITKVPASFPSERFREREELARGPLAAGAPGNLAGWCELVRAYGRKTLTEIFAPAIELARDGFPLIEFNVAAISECAEELKAQRAFYGDWAHAYHAGKGRIETGFVLRQPDLARTYEAIVEIGPGYLHGGALGRALVAHVDSLGGCLSLGDLEAVAPVWLDPVAARYRDMLVHTLPPPCEGFQYLLTLRILDGFDLGRFERNGIDHLDIVYRAMSVADRDGNVVCITQSLGAKFGCGVVIPGHGVCLNNFLYWGEVNPNGTNYLRPGGSLALPMAPSIATRDSRPVLALGTPGSYGICQTQSQVMVQHVDFALGLQAAIEAPRARLLDGRRIVVESRIDDDTILSLRARGHAVEVTAPWTMTVGGMQGVVVDAVTGALTGAADPRRDGYVATP